MQCPHFHHSERPADHGTWVLPRGDAFATPDQSQRPQWNGVMLKARSLFFKHVHAQPETRAGYVIQLGCSEIDI
jgi:hypothetical protein